MLISFQMLLCLFMLNCGIISFISVRKHLLNSLLSLEFIMLSVYFMMGVGITHLGGDNYFILFFLTLAACEGALGLALLVAMVRSHGNDHFNSFHLLVC
uniref:NADH-ubiquinone oxidoreductase chain 4L n=1 Tax=Thor amboinensis TaxID=652917 RepID=A0A7G7MWP0_9EUCA|nr:NADH dehydrogenase subunit 4L [Thor amboinensis]QNG57249.1 NADH dehydrogenase subunit 4L [Thor amboinensis]